MKDKRRSKIDWTPIVYERTPHPTDAIALCDIHGLWYWKRSGCQCCHAWVRLT